MPNNKYLELDEFLEKIGEMISNEVPDLQQGFYLEELLQYCEFMLEHIYSDDEN